MDNGERRTEIMNLKKTAICTAIVLSIVLSVIIIYSALPWLILYFGKIFSKNPPEPKIKYGEFPYSITFRIDGETRVFSGKYICRFKGFSWNEGSGKFRQWEGSIDDTGEECILLIEDENNKVYCSIGYPEYYMGDTEAISVKYPGEPHLFVEQKDINDQTIWLPGKIMSVYNIEIVSWDFSDPIQNEFTE